MPTSPGALPKPIMTTARRDSFIVDAPFTALMPLLRCVGSYPSKGKPSGLLIV